MAKKESRQNNGDKKKPRIMIAPDKISKLFSEDHQYIEDLKGEESGEESSLKLDLE